MGAKQQLLGSADDKLPPTVTFGPGGDAASPLAHTLPRGWDADFPPSIPQARQAPKADSRFSVPREL